MSEKLGIAVEEYVGKSLLWTYTREKKNPSQNEGGYSLPALPGLFLRVFKHRRVP